MHLMPFLLAFQLLVILLIGQGYIAGTLQVNICILMPFLLAFQLLTLLLPAQQHIAGKHIILLPEERCITGKCIHFNATPTSFSITNHFITSTMTHYR